MDQAELDNRFSYHAPKGNQGQRYEAIRAKAKELAELFEASCPESREKSVAFTELESAVMWANASIARRDNAGGTRIQVPPEGAAYRVTKGGGVTQIDPSEIPRS